MVVYGIGIAAPAAGRFKKGRFSNPAAKTGGRYPVRCIHDVLLAVTVPAMLTLYARVNPDIARFITLSMDVQVSIVLRRLFKYACAVIDT